mmetsp:Transcript_75175/g.168334  ORF Transcript_75175/g.168334 Transcript_75175/m.168334 type:complete len:531 (-) Transcript_75175:851-2443(-)
MVGHLAQVAGLPVRGPKPRLLEVRVQLLDHLVLVPLQRIQHLLAWQGEVLLVEDPPQHGAAVLHHVDGLAELGLHGNHASRIAVLAEAELPLLLLHALRGKQEVLGHVAGVRLHCCKHAAPHQHAVDRHARPPEAERPVAREPLVGIGSRPQASTDHEGDVLGAADQGVGLQQRLVLVLEGVMASRPPPSPLDDELEAGEVAADLKHGVDGARRAWLEGDEVEPCTLGRLHDVPELLERRNASGDCDGFQGLALQRKLFDKRELEAPEVSVEVEEVERDPRTSRHAERELPDLLGKVPGQRDAAARQLGMVPCPLGRRHLRGMRPRRHAGDHDWRAAHEPSELRLDATLGVEARREAMHPGGQGRQPGEALLQERGHALDALLHCTGRGLDSGVHHHRSIATVQEARELRRGERGAHVEHVAGPRRQGLGRRHPVQRRCRLHGHQPLEVEALERVAVHGAEDREAQGRALGAQLTEASETRLGCHVGMDLQFDTCQARRVEGNRHVQELREELRRALRKGHPRLVLVDRP